MIKRLSKPASKIFQFKVILLGVKPPIWRRIQLNAECTFWDLHVAIQGALGWTDSHLHQFEIQGAKLREFIYVGFPDPKSPVEVLADWGTQVRKFLKTERAKAVYQYDFGDNWVHGILLEKILPAQRATDYPICIAGARRCPPEDCGGVYGFANFLKIMKSPKHKQHKEMVQWAGGVFDPTDFDPAKVVFDNAKKRLKVVLNDLPW